MIRYDLVCEREDAFEGWFRDSADFDAQAEAGGLACPVCGSGAVRKAVMAPAVISSERRAATAQALAAARAKIRDEFEYVGERFAEEARAMHEGEIDHRPVWGEATPEDAKALIEAGAPVAPLPPGLTPIPPRKIN